VIQTIEELVALTDADAATETLPLIADELRLRVPGSSLDMLERIRAALPGMPVSYLEVAAKIDLSFVSINGLVVAPGKRNEDNLLTRLTNANSPASPQWDYVEDHCLYEVAHYPGSLVCVRRENTERPGEVVRVDYEWGGVDNLVLRRTSWSFEQMLLGFGRIKEQFFAERRGPEVIDEVLGSLRTDFGFDEEQMEDWARFASEALGEF
jgi:hypothetical protein